MYPEDQDLGNSFEGGFVYTPNETPPNEEAQYGQGLLDHSPRNALSTPPNCDSGVWGKNVSLATTLTFEFSLCTFLIQLNCDNANSGHFVVTVITDASWPKVRLP